jgi:hypothetical protein
MGSKYGRIADVLRTGIPYVEPRPTAAQYLPVLEPTDSPLLSAAMREKLKERAYDRYQTRLDEMIKDKVKIYFDFMASVGAESTILIKRHAQYLVECGQNRDSDALVGIIASTLYNEIGGNIELRKHFMREKKELEFGFFKMTSEMDISSFYKQFVEFRATLTKQGHPVPEDRREAQKFLQRLDDRYSEMMTSMANGTTPEVWQQPTKLRQCTSCRRRSLRNRRVPPRQHILLKKRSRKLGTEQIEARQQASAEVLVGAERAVEEEAHRKRREALRRTSY